MFGPQKNHPIMIFDNFFKDFFVSILGLIILFVRNSNAQDLSWEFFLFAMIFIAPISKVFSYVSTTFQLVNGTLIINKGVFSKTKTEIHVNTISTVDISQSFLYRVFKVYKLRINNSSASVSNEADLALNFVDATRLRSLLLRESANQTDQNTQQEDVETLTAKMSSFIILGVLQSKIIYAIQLYVLVTGLVPFLINLSIIPDLESIFSDFSERISIPIMITVIIIVIYIISFFWSLIITLIRYYKFEVTKKNEKILINYGLVKKNSFSLPIEKICGIKVSQSFFMRIFKLYRLDVFAIGYGNGVQSSEQSILFPAAKLNIIAEILSKTLPEFILPKFTQKPPKKAIRYFFLNFYMFLSVILIGISLVITNGYTLAFSLVFLVYSLIRSILRYKTTAMSIYENNVCFISGSYSKKLIIVPTHLIESISAKTNVFKRKHKIYTIALKFFAPQTVSTLIIKNMDYNNFIDLKHTLI